VDDIGGACNMHRNEKYQILVRKPTGKRPLITPICRWTDNIRMDLREIQWKGVD